jgi:hypothetical protein
MNIWGRLGISVAIVAMFCIVILEVLQGQAFYQVYRWAMCAVLLAMGVLLLVTGGFINAKIREGQRYDPDGPTGPFLLVNLQYWGLMLTIFGIIVICIVPHKKVEAHESKAAAPKPKIVKKVVAPIVTNETRKQSVPAPHPVAFPSLKLQGIVHRETNPSALINGRTYFVGNYIAGTRLISINATSVVVEFSGQQRELQLRP